MSDESSDNVVVRIDIPLDHHPKNVHGESPGAQLGRRAMEQIYDAAGKINDTAERVRDKARLAAAAQPFAERALAGADRAMQTMAQHRERLDAEIAEALAPPVEPALAAQIRSHWQGQAKSLASIQQAIVSGDAATMSAVLNAPAYLSGLNEQQQAVLRTAAADAVAPDKVAERNEAADAHARVARAASHFADTVGERLRDWQDADQRLIEEGLR